MQDRKVIEFNILNNIIKKLWFILIFFMEGFRTLSVTCKMFVNSIFIKCLTLIIKKVKRVEIRQLKAWICQNYKTAEKKEKTEYMKLNSIDQTLEERIK